MKTFKSITDVDRFRNHPLHDTIMSLVVSVIKEYPDSAPYRPEDDGLLICAEY